MATRDHLQPLTITVEQAAGLLGISRGLAYELVRRQQIPSVRLGRRIVVPLRAIDELLAINDLSDGDLSTPAGTHEETTVSLGSVPSNPG